jgi:hypothetical protein
LAFDLLPSKETGENRSAVKRHPIRNVFLIVSGISGLIIVASLMIEANSIPKEKTRIAAVQTTMQEDKRLKLERSREGQG